MKVFIIMRANQSLVGVVTDLSDFASHNGYEMPDESGEMRKKGSPSVYVYAQTTVDLYKQRKVGK